VIVGRIGRPHGVRGEVTVVPETDDPSRFASGSTVTTGQGRDLVVVSSSPYRDKGLIVLFEGVSDRTATRRALGDREFWPDELVGLEAVDPEGGVLGVVAALDLGSAQDRLVIRTPEGRDILVPFVDAIVGDPNGETIEIRDPGGLF
jgi:16S rRNA processing protein RimM